MTGPLRHSTLIVALAALAVAGFLLWSMLAHVDQVTRATGQVIPSGRTQIVQSAEGGTIAEILVREGDRVRRGELLVRLDEVRLRAQVDEGEATVGSLKAKMARIQAELFDKPLTFPADLERFPEFTANQRQLYLRRRAALQADLGSLGSMRTLMTQELQMNLPLVDSGDVSRSEILRMRRSVAEVDGQIATRRNEYLQQLQAEYAQTESELTVAAQQLAQSQSSLNGVELRAPADGVVVNVRLTTIGGVLRPGDEMLQIVPTGDRLIVEAKVSPAEIAFIRVGQPASVKFDAYDSAIYGAGWGRVAYVSADTLTEQTPQGPKPYYRVNLSVDASNLRPRRRGDRIALQPGMTATAEIITGESTVFRYLTKPILKTSSEALRER